MAQPPREKGGRVVFIGNIPYGVSEEQIMELFGRCGKVVSFRLVYDKDTGRPKGFGFLEYETPDAAAAAVRNLNEFEIMGRQLKVDYSNDNDKGAKDAAAGAPAQGNGSLPPLPPGQPLAPGLSAPDAISKTLNAIPAPQLLDILSQMKALVTSDPAKATQLLQGAPQLGYALFQALLLLGLVDTNILGSLVATTQAAPAPPPPPQAFPPQAPIPGYPPVPQHYAQPGFPPQNYATPPPVQQFQPPPQPAYALPPGLDPSVIETVKNLTRDQIMGLDEGARNEIIKIRMALGLQPVPN